MKGPMKKFYLYHQTRTKLHGFSFVFDSKYETYDRAAAAMKSRAQTGLWKVWKIEEVWEFA